MNQKKGTKDTILSVLIFVIGAAIVLSGIHYNNVSITTAGNLPAGVFPIICGVILMLLAVLLFVETKFIHKKAGEIIEKYVGPDIKEGLLTIGLFAAYILLYRPLGFIVASVLYLFAQMMVLSDHRNLKPILFAVISIVLPITVYFLFTRAFSLLLPKGILKFL